MIDPTDASTTVTDAETPTLLLAHQELVDPQLADAPHAARDLTSNLALSHHAVAKTSDVYTDHII